MATKNKLLATALTRAQFASQNLPINSTLAVLRTGNQLTQANNFTLSSIGANLPTYRQGAGLVFNPYAMRNFGYTLAASPTPTLQGTSPPVVTNSTLPSMVKTITFANSVYSSSPSGRAIYQQCCTYASSYPAIGDKVHIGVWLQRGSTSGKIYIGNNADVTKGFFEVDLANLPDQPVWIHAKSEYVNQSNVVHFLMTTTADTDGKYDAVFISTDTPNTIVHRGELTISDASAYGTPDKYYPDIYFPLPNADGSSLDGDAFQNPQNETTLTTPISVANNFSMYFKMRIKGFDSTDDNLLHTSYGVGLRSNETPTDNNRFSINFKRNGKLNSVWRINSATNTMGINSTNAVLTSAEMESGEIGVAVRKSSTTGFSIAINGRMITDFGASNPATLTGAFAVALVQAHFGNGASGTAPSSPSHLISNYSEYSDFAVWERVLTDEEMLAVSKYVDAGGSGSSGSKGITSNQFTSNLVN